MIFKRKTEDQKNVCQVFIVKLSVNKGIFPPICLHNFPDP